MSAPELERAGRIEVSPWQVLSRHLVVYTAVPSPEQAPSSTQNSDRNGVPKTEILESLFLVLRPETSGGAKAGLLGERRAGNGARDAGCAEDGAASGSTKKRGGHCG